MYSVFVWHLGILTKNKEKKGNCPNVFPEHICADSCVTISLAAD